MMDTECPDSQDVQESEGAALQGETPSRPPRREHRPHPYHTPSARNRSEGTAVGRSQYQPQNQNQEGLAILYAGNLGNHCMSCGTRQHRTCLMVTIFELQLRMEYLREGDHSQVMESGHIVICGANNHITTVLKQLNMSHEFAIRDGTATSRKQTILLLSEQARRETEKLVSPVTKECTQINILTRCGSLSWTRSFAKVVAYKAKSMVLLTNKNDPYESDADNVLAVLALQSLLDEQIAGNVIVEVSKKSTTRLLKFLLGLKVSSVQNLSSKLFVQRTRQCDLVDVYQQLLDHSKVVINL